MTRDAHIEIHKELHKALDSLVADFVEETRCQELLSNTTVMRLIEWSHKQTTDPSDIRGHMSDGSGHTQSTAT